MCDKDVFLWRSKGPTAPEVDKVSPNPRGVLTPQTSCCSSCRETRGSAGADPQGHVPRLLCLCVLGSEDLRPACSGCLEDGYVRCPAWERGGKDLVERGRAANTPVGKRGHPAGFPKHPVPFEYLLSPVEMGALIPTHVVLSPHKVA